MILKSEQNLYNPFIKDYSLTMDTAEFEQALKGKTIFRVAFSSSIAGEWQVKFKKFSKAKMKRMNLI